MTDTITGVAIPFAINPATGGVIWTSGPAKLAQNVRMILATRLGERPMNRNFGTQLREMVHEPNDGGLANLLARQVREALVQMEPRIAVADITFRGEGASLTLDVTYLPADRSKTETLLIPLG